MLKRGQAVDATEAEKVGAEAADVIMRFHAKRARTVDKEVVDAMMAELQEWRDETEENIRITCEARSREGYNQLHLRPGQGSGTTCGRGHRGQGAQMRKILWKHELDTWQDAVAKLREMAGIPKE